MMQFNVMAIPLRTSVLAGLILLPGLGWAQQPAKKTPASVVANRPSVALKQASQILDENRGSIAVIVAAGNTSLKLGTGFFIRSTGLLLTNFHVVEGMHLVGVKIPGTDGVLWAKEATGFDPDNDLVLLEVETKETKPVSLGDSDKAKVGEQIVVVGNPEGLEQTVSNGLLSGIREFNGRKLFQISAPVSEGSSGSPVFDSRGEVIAVVVSSVESGQNLNFAVPINYVVPLLAATAKQEISSLPKRNHNAIPTEASTADPVKLAVEAMRKTADQIKACPERVLIRQTADKKSKLPFYASHEGPPTNVRFDVKPSDSLVAPFQGIVEFSIHLSMSQSVKTPEQAASAPEQPYLLLRNLNNLYRYFYRVNGSTVELDYRTIYNEKQNEWLVLRGAAETCWELVGNK